MDRRVLWTILTITFSVSLVDSAKISSTTSKTNIEPTTAKADSVSTISSGTRGITNTTYLGSNGNPKLKFECIIFYECDQKYVVDSSNCSERMCDENMVCCAAPVFENSDTSKAPQTPINMNWNSTLQSVNKTTNESCICVPFFHCLPSQSETNQKTLECRSSSEVCCTRDNLYSDTILTTSSETIKVIRNTTYLGTNGNPKLKCKCVLFYECNHENVVDTSTSGERFQCENDVMVCCSVPEYENPKIPVLTVALNSAKQSVNETTIESCTCVPFYDCISSQSDTINPRIPECKSSIEVCCLTANLYSNPELHPLPTTPVPNNPNPHQESDICGKRKIIPGTAIVGSEDQWTTVFGEFPWMARLLKTTAAPNGSAINTNFFCEASIISSTIILTAAQCVSGKDVDEIKIRVGEYDIAEGAIGKAPYQERKVGSINIHPKYNSKTLFNDLALLSVTEPFNFTKHIAPICVNFMNSQWKAPNVYNPKSCIITGWNKAGSEVDHHNTMRRADISVIFRDQCQKELMQTRLGQKFQLDPSFVCASETEISKRNSVNAGAPLVCALKSNPKRYIQVGILSWRSFYHYTIPAVYSSLEANMEWITKTYNMLTIFEV